MNVKTLFTDLDGTLVKHSGDVTEDVIKSVKKLLDKKINVVLASGRHPDMMKSIHYKLGLKTPVIACNGGIIKDLHTKEVLYANPLSEDIIKRAIEIARELEVDWVVYEKNDILFEKMPPKSYKLPHINQLPKHLQANYLKINSLEEVFKESYLFLKIFLLFDNKVEAMERGRQMLNEIEGIDVVQSAKTYLDVMVHGSSKGQAMKRYVELMGIDIKNTIAIGDANDMDMTNMQVLGLQWEMP